LRGCTTNEDFFEFIHQKEADRPGHVQQRHGAGGGLFVILVFDIVMCREEMIKSLRMHAAIVGQNSTAALSSMTATTRGRR